MTTTYVALALLTGTVAGALFSFLEVPIPAPPNLAGIVGIVGIYFGYKLIEYWGVSYDLTKLLGI